MARQPSGEQVLHFTWQSQYAVPRKLRARIGSGFENLRDLVIGEPRNHRADHDTNRNPRIGKRRNRAKALLGMRCPRFHHPVERAIEGRDRQIDRHGAILGEDL